MTRGSEWPWKLCWIVIQKQWQGKSVSEIFRDLGTSGPKPSCIYKIIKRFKNREALTGRGRERRRDRALQGEDLLLFKRLILRDPVAFLDELQTKMFSLTVRVQFFRKKVSIPVYLIF